MTCEQIIIHLAEVVRKEVPDEQYQEMMQQFNYGDKHGRNQAAERLLAWFRRDGDEATRQERRTLLDQLADGSSCQMSAAREILAATRTLVTVSA